MQLYIHTGCLQVHESLSSGPSDRLPVHGPDVRAGLFKLVWRIAALIKNRKTYEQHSISTLLADTHLQVRTVVNCTWCVITSTYVEHTASAVDSMEFSRNRSNTISCSSVSIRLCSFAAALAAAEQYSYSLHHTDCTVLNSFVHNWTLANRDC
jgi:hypothetical protein